MQNNKITRIDSKRSFFNLNLKELWEYRDLIILFVKRDFKNSYKQTILGPLWIVIKPFLSTFVFTVIFGIIANISTDGIPQFIFYMSGNILWSYFSSCFSRSSSVFQSNARLFGKVYFPRLVVPISNILYNTVNFIIQFAMFLILAIIYMIIGANINPNILVCFLPIIMLHTALLGTGCGLIMSSITVKYRDLGVLSSFGITMWMYLTPVVYPVSQIPQGLRTIFLLNPAAPIVETFRCAFLGSGEFPWIYCLISAAVTVVILIFGILLFNRTEKNFIDTV